MYECNCSQLDGRTHAEDADIGVVVLPGVAFDAHCRRVGHGKGYYGMHPRFPEHT